MNQTNKVQRIQSPHKPLTQTYRFKFNLDQSYLSCFISKRPLQIKSRDKKPLNHYHRPQLKVPKDIIQKQIRSYNGTSPPYFDRHFNHKVLFTHYGQDQVYVDSQATNKTVSSDVESDEDQSKQQQDIVAQCIRVITEETSDKISEPQVYLNPQDSINIFTSQKYTNSTIKQQITQIKTSYGNKQMQFQINLNNVERDGRTTIMLRNIPNKYTQQMILAQIDQNGLFRKYNFFYLPIDYKNDCNVGYAFINLIDTQFIHRLYQEFNGKKWRRFNSEKICEVCYARLQGTGQLMNHFRDWKFKPLIYLNLETRLDNIQDIVQRQQNQRA